MEQKNTDGDGKDPKHVEKKEPPKVDKEADRRERANMVYASQFAYTIVIGTFLLGWLGKWVGTKLGGEGLSTTLMLLFGAIGFSAEMYRMWRMFAPPGNKDKKGKDAGDKNDKKS